MSEQINVAVLGLGNMGATHVKAAVESPWVSNIIGYEPDEKRAQERGSELKIKTTSNLDEILNDSSISLIYIATPNPTHVDLTAKALRAGKAVLCEKPMGESLEEARKMIAVQQETNGWLQLGFELHYSTLYKKVKDWINQGLIGDPVNTHCRYYCSEFHKKNTWRSNSEGSLIGEKLSHYLDGQRWFIGSPVESVYSITAPKVVSYFNHPDNHQINIRFANGSISTLIFNMFMPETDAVDPLLEVMEKQSDDGHYLQFHIFGTKGAIETDVFRRRIRRWKFTDGPEQLISEIAETIHFEKEDDLEWFHNVHGQNIRVSELVAKGLPPETSILDSYESMKLCFAAELSEKEHRIVKLSEIE